MSKLSSAVCITVAAMTVLACHGGAGKPPEAGKQAPAYFHVDPATAGTITGSVHFLGKRPRPVRINMSEDPACVEAHHGIAYDQSLVISPSGALGNAFVYVEKGLEGKEFQTPSTPVTITQQGCWFRPRVMGIQTGQAFEVVNDDPVTHNIHPMGQVNREWNHSQGAGDPPVLRRFLKPEVMIPIKCNIHSWMHAFVGVLTHPYFAVSSDDGTFEIKGLPPGTYTLAVWQEKLGVQRQQVSVNASGQAVANFKFAPQ